MTTLDTKLTTLATQIALARAAMDGATSIPPSTPDDLAAAVQDVVDGFAGQLAAPSGAGLVKSIQLGTGAVARPVQDVLRDLSNTPEGFYVSGSHNAAAQAALADGNLTFIGGRTYTLSAGEIPIPSNRKITVEKGAVINCTDVRFCAYDVSNVEWQIDGIINVLSMAAAPAKTGWPNTAAGTQLGDERGFIEFGGSSTSVITSSGFIVRITGSVTGPWTGTPNFSDQEYQVNRKGIACWNCKNVSISGGGEVIGFDGEAVYFRGESPDCVNIDFNRLHVHHSRFNGVNFNAGPLFDGLGPNNGLRIRNCTVHDVYQGIEMCVGTAEKNNIADTTSHGIYFGVGSGTGPIRVASNTVVRAGNVSYFLAFNPSESPTQKVDVSNNRAIDGAQNAFILQKCKNFAFKDNTSSGHGRVSAGYAFNIYLCNSGVVDGNTCLEPGAFSSGALLDTSNTDVTFGINHTATSGGAASAYWYKEGTFVPTAVGLTVVNGTGAVFYDGTYTRIGRLVHWQIIVTPTGTATTAASLVGTTFTGMPFACPQTAPCIAATGEVKSLLSGYVAGTTVFPPAWTASNYVVVISGTYTI